MNLLDMVKQNIHEFKVRNTNDPQLQAFTEFYDPRITGRQVTPDVEVYTEQLKRNRQMQGNPYIDFSGMPTFESGQGTESNPLLAAMNAVGVTGFRGGSSPINQTNAYDRSRYTSGPFAGLSTETVRNVDNGQLTQQYLTHTDQGTYDFDNQKWYDWKYRTN